MKKALKKIIKKLLPLQFYNDLVPYLWHLPKAILSNIVFDFPSRKLRVIGIAGTKGKSTTTYLINQFLESLKFKTAILSTTTVKIGEIERLNEFKMTSVDSWELQKFLRKAVEENCQFVVLEVSSHALKQFRTFGINFEIVVLTNLMSDHLEYHRDTKDYQKTHRKLITKNSKVLVLNNDDENLEDFKKIYLKQVSFGLNSGSSLLVKSHTIDKTGAVFSLIYSGESFGENKPGELGEFSSPLIGRFNLFNVLAALSTIIALGFDILKLKDSVENLQAAPGRVEKIENNLGIEILVDYAHSPDSLENLLGALKPNLKGRLIAVFGATGERDPAKRPIMGEILAKYCDHVFVTNDDPYGEDPEKIAFQLIGGLIESGKIGEEDYEKILDRKEAIKNAILTAKRGDTVVIMGKGSEQWQVFKNLKIPWDDRKVVREVLSES